MKQMESYAQAYAKERCIEFLIWAIKNHSVPYEGFSLSEFADGSFKKFVGHEEKTMDEFYELFNTINTKQ